MKLEEAVEGPVHELVPGRISQTSALNQEVPKSKGQVNGGHGEAQVHPAVGHVVHLIIRPSHDLPNDVRANALCSNGPNHRPHRRDNLEPHRPQVIDDDVNRIVRGKADEKAAGSAVGIDVLDAFCPSDSTCHRLHRCWRAWFWHPEAGTASHVMLEVDRFSGGPGHFQRVVVEVLAGAERRRRARVGEVRFGAVPRTTRNLPRSASR